MIVTHDPVEAVALADRTLVLQDGSALQYAPSAQIARAPRPPWEVTPDAAAELRLGEGAGVWTQVKAGETTLVAV
ncbi:ABC-type sulfate/molybdate transport systems ATPase subunit [Streptacidiphilus sp. MAP12-33]